MVINVVIVDDMHFSSYFVFINLRFDKILITAFNLNSSPVIGNQNYIELLTAELEPLATIIARCI